MSSVTEDKIGSAVDWTGNLEISIFVVSSDNLAKILQVGLVLCLRQRTLGVPKGGSHIEEAGIRLVHPRNNVSYILLFPPQPNSELGDDRNLGIGRLSKLFSFDVGISQVSLTLA